METIAMYVILGMAVLVACVCLRRRIRHRQELDDFEAQLWGQRVKVRSVDDARYGL